MLYLSGNWVLTLTINEKKNTYKIFTESYNAFKILINSVTHEIMLTLTCTISTNI